MSVQVYHQSCIEYSFPYFRNVVFHADRSIISHVLFTILLMDHYDPGNLEVGGDVSTRVDRVE